MKTVGKKAGDILVTAVVDATVFLNNDQAQNLLIPSPKSNSLERTITLDLFDDPAASHRKGLRQSRRRTPAKQWKDTPAT